MSILKVLLRGPFDTTSGYGNDLVGMTRGFRFTELEADVQVLPTQVVPPIPQDVAQLLCRAPEPPVDLAIVHTDPHELEMPPGLRRFSDIAVAWTMWEQETYTDGEDDIPLAVRLKDFDILLTYDPVSFAALDPHVPDGTAHFQMQGGYWADDWVDDWNSERRDWQGPFRFGMLGKLTVRKNPFAAVEAFGRLKEEHGDAFDATLHLKTTDRTLHPKMMETYPWLRIYYERWEQPQIMDFYRSMHCLLAPSRGEGKNVPALEAMTTGIPVIATNYGGHTVWLSEQWAYPLRYSKVDATPYEGTGEWAEPDIDHLVELMWHVYTHREEARQKGELASRTIPAMADWGQVIKRLLQTVARVKNAVPV